MKEEKLSSFIRKKVTKNANAKCFKCSEVEMLKLMKEHVIDTVTSIDELEKMKLTKLFPFFGVRIIESEKNGYLFKSYVWPRSLFSHYTVLLFVNNDVVYSLGILWLCCGGFKRKVKKMVVDKQLSLKK